MKIRVKPQIYLALEERKYDLPYFIQDPKTLDRKTGIQTFSDKDIQDGPSSKNCHIEQHQFGLTLKELETEASLDGVHGSINVFVITEKSLEMIEKSLVYLSKKHADNQNIKDAMNRWLNKESIALYPFQKPDKRNASCIFDGHKKISLHFHSFIKEGQWIHTCLSSDIVAHETGHAILNILVPYFGSQGNLLTKALHESFGDLTAIFSILEDNESRKSFMNETNGDLKMPSFLTNLAEPLAKSSKEKALRKTMNYKLSGIPGDFHSISQVFTGIISQILAESCQEQYDRFPKEDRSNILKKTAAKLRSLVLQAFIEVGPSATFTSVIETMRKICILNSDFYIFEAYLIEAFKSKGIDSEWEEEVLKSEVKSSQSRFCSTMCGSDDENFMGNNEQLEQDPQNSSLTKGRGQLTDKYAPLAFGCKITG